MRGAVSPGTVSCSIRGCDLMLLYAFAGFVMDNLWLDTLVASRCFA